jgi:hypothetical protein
MPYGTLTHFPYGISNVSSTDTLGGFVAPDPTKVHQWFDDFDNFVAAQWVVTRVGVTPTEAAQSQDGGILLLTMAATDDSSDSLQWSGDDLAATAETFKFEPGKRLWFKTRVKVSDVTQSDFVLGLQITDTTPLAVSDGVFFIKNDGDSNINLVVSKASVATTTTVSGALANDTYVTLGYYYDGATGIDLFINDIRRATSVVTNLPNVEELTVSIHMQNGEAVAKTMSLDYIFVAKER